MVVWLLCTYTIERKLRGNYWTCYKTLPEIFLHEHCSWCWRQIERLRYICTFFSILCPPHNLQGGYTESWWVAPTLTPNPISPLTFLRENSESSFSQTYTGCSFQIPTFVLKLYIISLYQQLIQAIQSPSKF